MKINTKPNKTSFIPFTMEISVDSLSDLETLLAIFNVSPVDTAINVNNLCNPKFKTKDIDRQTILDIFISLKDEHPNKDNF